MRVQLLLTTRGPLYYPPPRPSHVHQNHPLRRHHWLLAHYFVIIRYYTTVVSSTNTRRQHHYIHLPKFNGGPAAARAHDYLLLLYLRYLFTIITILLY